MVRFPASVLAAVSAVFASMHVAWALGWRWGIPDEMASVGERPAFLAYDLAAGLGMLALAALALTVVTREGTLRKRWVRRLLGAVACVCALRAAIGIPGDVAALAHEELTAVSVLADGWFLVVSTLCVVLLARSARARREP